MTEQQRQDLLAQIDDMIATNQEALTASVTTMTRVNEEFKSNSEALEVALTKLEKTVS